MKLLIYVCVCKLMLHITSGVIYIYLILFCYWKYKLSASVSTSRSLNKLTHVSSICHWDMKLESAEIDICLIVIWGSKYLISKIFSLLMNDASDMNNIGSQGITGIFELLWMNVLICHSSSLPYIHIVRLFLNYFCQSQGFILFLQQLLDGLWRIHLVSCHSDHSSYGI